MVARRFEVARVTRQCVCRADDLPQDAVGGGERHRREVGGLELMKRGPDKVEINQSSHGRECLQWLFGHHLRQLAGPLNVHRVFCQWPRCPQRSRERRPGLLEVRHHGLGPQKAEPAQEVPSLFTIQLLEHDPELGDAQVSLEVEAQAGGSPGGFMGQPELVLDAAVHPDGEAVGDDLQGEIDRHLLQAGALTRVLALDGAKPPEGIGDDPEVVDVPLEEVVERHRLLKWLPKVRDPPLAASKVKALVSTAQDPEVDIRACACSTSGDAARHRDRDGSFAHQPRGLTKREALQSKGGLEV